MKRVGLLFFVGIFLACGFIPERVSFDDPRVMKLMEALKPVNRTALGFTRIDPDAPLRLEWRPRAGYDAMLHVGGKTSRTIAFRRKGELYEWIGEQEIFEGPDEFDTVDGRCHEEITITFHTVPMFGGPPINTIFITYIGEDRRLLELDLRRQLSLEIVRPVLTKWGYGE